MPISNRQNGIVSSKQDVLSNTLRVGTAQVCTQLAGIVVDRGNFFAISTKDFIAIGKCRVGQNVFDAHHARLIALLPLPIDQRPECSSERPAGYHAVFIRRKPGRRFLRNAARLRRSSER